jgi:hypothetical protein
MCELDETKLDVLNSQKPGFSNNTLANFSNGRVGDSKKLMISAVQLSVVTHQRTIWLLSKKLGLGVYN